MNGNDILSSTFKVTKSWIKYSCDFKFDLIDQKYYTYLLASIKSIPQKHASPCASQNDVLPKVTAINIQLCCRFWSKHNGGSPATLVRMYVT